MSARKSRIGWGLLIVAVGGICLGLSRSSAQQEAATPAPEKLLPQDAVLYIGWDGHAHHQEAWEQTAAYESLYKSGLVPALSKAAKALIGQAGRPEAELISKVYDHLVAHGLSLAVSLTAEAGPPQPVAVLVIHQAAELEPALAKLLKENAGDDLQIETETIRGRQVNRAPLPDAPGFEFGWWTEGRHLVIVAGVAAVEATIDTAEGQNGRGNITKNRLWSKYRGEADFAVTSVGWVDLKTLRDMLGEMPLPAQTAAGDPLTINRVLKPLGLDGLDALVGRSGYKGKAVWSEGTAETHGPRRGLLALAEQQPMQLGDLPPLPAGTAGFFAFSLDWAKMYDDLSTMAKELAALGPPQVHQQVVGVIDNLPQILPIHPREDLLAPLGNVTCLYGDSQQTLFGLGIGLAIKVDDADKLRGTLDEIAGAVAEQTNPRDFQVRKTEKHGAEIVTLEFARGMFNPSYVIQDGWLNVGLFPQAAEAFVLRTAGKLPTWKPSDEIQEALSQMPGEFTSISVADPRPTVQMLMSLAPIVFPLAQQALRDAAGGDRRDENPLPISLADLPPAELVAGPLFPNVSVSTVTEDGFHGTSRTSLPAFPFVGSGGGGSVATTGVLVGLLLPAVQQAREAARRTQSMNNLRQLGIALHNHHDVHQKLPSGTHPNEKLKPEKRLSWQASILPYIEQQALYRTLDFDEAWDSEANQPHARHTLPVFLNPGIAAGSYEQAVEKARAGEYGQTHYVGIAGVGKDAPTLPVTDQRAGMFGYERATRLADVLDGLSNTVMVSEASKDFGPWAAGGSATIRAFTTKPYINGPDGIGGPWSGDGCQMLLGDGSARFISKSIDPGVLEALSTIRGGEVVGGF
jgi:hypothetical protein